MVSKSYFTTTFHYPWELLRNVDKVLFPLNWENTTPKPAPINVKPHPLVVHSDCGMSVYCPPPTPESHIAPHREGYNPVNPRGKQERHLENLSISNAKQHWESNTCNSAIAAILITGIFLQLSIDKWTLQISSNSNSLRCLNEPFIFELLTRFPS